MYRFDRGAGSIAGDRRPLMPIGPVGGTRKKRRHRGVLQLGQSQNLVVDRYQLMDTRPPGERRDGAFTKLEAAISTLLWML